MRWLGQSFVYGLLLAGGIVIGMWLQHARQPVSPAVADPSPGASAAREVLYWWDPMMPEYRSDKPGKSPMGMEMVPVYADAASATTVRIAPEVVNNLGVRTEPAVKGRLDRRIETGGFVDYDETRTTHVLAPVAGRIGGLAVTAVGQRVGKGDMLFVIEGEDRSTTPVLAAADGVIATLERIYNGMPLVTGTDIMTIVDPGIVWIKGELFETDAAWLRVGQIAEARFRGRPGQLWTGSVQVIAPKVEYSTRTVRYRMRFDNPGEFLVPNMFAEVSLHVESDGEVVHIPRQALIRDGGDSRIILALGDGRFAPRDVTVGVEVGERIEIREGLSAGEMVVSSAQFLIDSEASLNQSLARLQSGEPAGPAGAATQDHQHHHHP